ncbi:MAG: hypothetical protein WCV73_02960 [Patescibacteria group bacterium]|jgi:hypothetical protein
MQPEQINKKIESFLAGLKDLPNRQAESKKTVEVEKTVEQAVELPANQLEKPTEVQEKSEFTNPAIQSLPSVNDITPAVKTPVFYQVEGILAEGLEQEYLKLTPEKQLQFREVGEETASKIALLLKSAKVKVKEIFRLILDWLKIIPGLNKFFLEQEAKIKADRILAFKKKMDKDKL